MCGIRRALCDLYDSDRGAMHAQLKRDMPRCDVAVDGIVVGRAASLAHVVRAIRALCPRDQDDTLAMLTQTPMACMIMAAMGGPGTSRIFAEVPNEALRISVTTVGVAGDQVVIRISKLLRMVTMHDDGAGCDPGTTLLFRIDVDTRLCTLAFFWKCRGDRVA